MMIELDYMLSPTSPDQKSRLDLSCADEGALHYELFLGNVRFRIDRTNFSAEWGWIPVLDFAIGLVRVLESLARGENESFEFTESEATLHFVREETNVTVSANYVEGTASIDYGEMLSHARKFLCRVLSELCSDHPSLESNPFFAQLRREALHAIGNK